VAGIGGIADARSHGRASAPIGETGECIRSAWRSENLVAGRPSEAAIVGFGLVFEEYASTNQRFSRVECVILIALNRPGAAT
jgi:hypothetical protein